MRKSARAYAEDRQARRVGNQLAIAERLARQNTPKDYPVTIHNTMQPGAAYLVEFSHEREDPPSLRLFGWNELVDFLTHNEEQHHYTGDWSEVAGIWRYDGNGGLTRLVLNSRASRTDDNDYIHADYVVREETETAKVEIAFTVRLDGRV